jgi:protocatechuate 3,4-dioxygenase, alpha subunit
MKPTAHITAGPFFPASFIRPEDADLTRGGRIDGQPVTLSGTVSDVAGRLCVNVIIELWQADPTGSFGLWGRTWTDGAGSYRFQTVKPGTTVPPGRNRPRPPYLNLMIHASGLMRPLVTQMFFPDEALNDEDPQLQLVPSARRPLLVARLQAGGGLRFDIALAGPNETPFFDD